MRDVLPLPDTPLADQASAITPHVASLGALGAAFMGWLPGIIAIVPAVYYMLLIYESKTVQRWIARHRVKKIARRIHSKKFKPTALQRLSTMGGYVFLLLALMLFALAVAAGFVHFN